MSLGQEGVNLFDEFQSRIHLVQNQRINIIDSDWDLSFFEENLQLQPVVLFLRITLSIVERMHLEV